MHEIEIILNIWLQGLGNWLLIPMQLFSFLGTQYAQMIIFSWIYWCLDNQVGIRLGIALVIGNGFNTAFKWIFHSPRPYWIDPNVRALGTESSFGIPSGHAMMSTVFFGRIVIWVKEKWFTIFVYITIFLIGLSRIYLGVHFLSDVIAGCCFGISVMIILYQLEKPVSEWLKKKSFWMQIGIFFGSSILILLIFMALKNLLSDWQIPASWRDNIQSTAPGSAINPIRMKDIITLSGLWFGILMGHAWIMKEGGFTTSGNGIQYLLRLFIGFSGLGIIMFIFGQLDPIIKDEMVKGLVTYLQFFFISVWITAAAPFIFIKTGLSNYKEL